MGLDVSSELVFGPVSACELELELELKNKDDE
jgi:hypothetical protein